MKLHRFIPASVGILVLVGAVPAAFAGSAGVTNSWSTRDIKNGKYEMNVDVYDKYYYHRDAKATAWKEEYGATLITDNIGDSSSGVCSSSSRCDRPSRNEDSTKFVELDLYKAGSDSYAKEWGKGYTYTTVDIKETYDFSGFDKTHSVSSSFSY